MSASAGIESGSDFSAASQPGCVPSASAPHGSYLGLRIAALFVILFGSTLGALLPVLLVRRAQVQSGPQVPQAWLNFAKYFGSGVILGTAFIHLLAPGIEALNNPCLSPGWRKYPYALGLCLCSILGIFIVSVVSTRYGALVGAKNGQPGSSEHASPPNLNLDINEQAVAAEFAEEGGVDAKMRTSIIGLAILEFGAILHRSVCTRINLIWHARCIPLISVLIGLTLAVDPKFKVLFAVLVTHQIFEGLGIGSRLASVRLPARCAHVPIIGAVVFGLSTPLGMAVGLAARATYNANDPGALVVSGVLDSLSAGILMYTALVELLGREILFNEELMRGPARTQVSAVLWVFLGCCVMALLGKWV
ncbi:Zinc/iron permease [Mycena vitilis]|nr:Zinc/iron permease [Mycena vitilis]